MHLNAVIRYLPWLLSLIASVLCAVATTYWSGALWPTLLFALAAGLGSWDMLQRRHNLRRNYPLSARLRWLFEAIRPELRQYLFESETDGRPFSREQRSLVYERAKNDNDKQPFGTLQDVYAADHEWINHSAMPREKSAQPYRVQVGGPHCAQPYSASVFNISAMSFGSLSANAIRALNQGARLGAFYHDSGEGGISPYHLEHGGDLVWEIGSGYFGCRDQHGQFDPARFADMAMRPEVRMIEIKLSQGAKPGHGGVLPGSKVSREIALTRGIAEARDCISPPCHSAFSSPLEMMHFVAQLRELCASKPIGLKLCIGHTSEFMSMVKAMLETGIVPDFIVIDGAEGGTGAAPLELTNHVGTPLREGLVLAQNVLVGAGLRDQLKLAAAGKITSASRLAFNLALGADWCNAARGFMLALGCVQSLSCHTDRCPTGVATQDSMRQRALDVSDKAQRVHNFHRHTVDALIEIVAAAGLDHPHALSPHHLYRRNGPGQVASAAEFYEWLEPGELLESPRGNWKETWKAARADRFVML